MPSSIIYLDESGDLGWTLTEPYLRGGSSRYLTISALVVSPENKAYPKRVIRDLYKKFHWPTSIEMKWAAMDQTQRQNFVQLAKQMCVKYPDIELHAIVVKKENVLEHIRKDGNKLYNYMIKLSLIEKMAECDVVTLIPDPRSIKVQSGNSLHDYLQTELWFTKKASTNLLTTPLDSKSCLGLQFSDMVAGVVQARFERNENTLFQQLAPHLKIKRLYF